MGLPAQVSPPQIALSDVAPLPVVGVDIVAVPVLAGDDGPDARPRRRRAASTTSTSTCSRVLDAAAATGATGEVTERGRRATPPTLTNPTLRLRAAGRRRRRQHRPTCAARGRPWPGARRAAGRSPPPLPPWRRRRPARPSSRAGARLLRVPLRIDRPASSSPVRPGRARADRPTPTAAPAARQGAGRGRRRLAVADPGQLVPSNVKTPGLAGRAGRRRRPRRAGPRRSRCWDEKQLAEQGFGGIVGVGQGSASPPRLVQLDYAPASAARRKAPHVVLVGKGITFDTGGLSIKPRDGMMTMKRDMTGAAVVLAVMAALRRRSTARSGSPALLPLAENCRRRRARPRPGDVLPALRRPHHARSPTPTPRAGWCSPTRWPTPSPSSRPTRWSTSPP